MTAQIVDVANYKGQWYEVAALKGASLPSIKDLGFETRLMHTACWRANYREYTIEDNAFFLSHLVVSSFHDRYPPLVGVEAIYREEYILHPDEPKPEPLLGRWVFTDLHTNERIVHHDGGIYTGLKMRINVSGGILIGKNYSGIVNVHSGFNISAAYKEVIELQFENGNLISAIDHSQTNAEINEYLLKHYIKDLTEEKASRVVDLLKWTEGWQEIDY